MSLTIYVIKLLYSNHLVGKPLRHQKLRLFNHCVCLRVQVGLQRNRLPHHGLLRAVAVLLLLLLAAALLHLPDRGVRPGPGRHHRVTVRLLRHATVQRSPSRYGHR